MISFINKNNKLNEVKNSLCITYPRTVNIIYGNYPYPHIIHNLILDIKNNLNYEMENYTNVKGGMTKWDHFLENDNFKGFIAYLINTHQNSHSDIFKYFLEKNFVENAWGNEIKLGDSLNYHHHPCLHGILYLTEGCDLILPELNLKITPQPGDYYIFPPNILHGFDKYEEENNRYSLIFNIKEKNNKFDFNKKLASVRCRS
jgi:quercetin dioxygenase-like cupin family protein